MELETKYYKDLNHSYLVVKSKTDEEILEGTVKISKKGDYQNRMISGNRMKRLLSCSIRSMNQEICYYYEISSRQSLKQAYANRLLGLVDLHCLFNNIYEASSEIREYLLDDSHILLEPEFIFLTPGTGAYAFVYYPRNFDWNRAMMSLAEYLVERVDHEDDKALEAVYGIYESILNQTFTLSEVLSRFPKEAPACCYHGSAGVTGPSALSELRSETEWDAGTEAAQERKRTQGLRAGEEQETEAAEGKAEGEGPAQPPDRRNEVRKDAEAYRNSAGREKGVNDVRYGADYEEDDVSECESTKEREQNHSRLASVILLILTGTAAAGVFTVRYFFLLTPEENLLSIAGSVALMAVSALLLLYLLAFPVEKRRRTKCQERKGDLPEAEDVRELQRWESPPTVWSMTPAERFTEPEVSLSAEPEVSENTVFFETSFTGGNRKLYGVNRGNRYHIDLTRLPCTIGKMAGGVDFVIKDDSISRIHARIMQEGDEILVTDLNSTNGTFKNGLQLEPNETAPLEPGDEIRFGRMTFCYR